MSDYHARIIDSDVLGRHVRLAVARRVSGTIEYLGSDGRWFVAPENADVTDRVGVELPPDALQAVAEAVGKYLGNALPSQAEVAVLREVLKVERGRVDRYLPGAPS